MANKLITPQELVRQIIDESNRQAAKHGINAADVALALIASLRQPPGDTIEIGRSHD